MVRTWIILALLAISCRERGYPEGEVQTEPRPLHTEQPDAGGSPGDSGASAVAGGDAPELAAAAETDAGGFGVRVDPPGYRSFDAPAAPLPPRPAAPAYVAQSDPCPEGMIHVRGQRCSVPTQECLGWVDDPGKPPRACGQFREPSSCAGARHGLNFCIDRLEYTPAGWALPLVNVAWNEASRICGSMKKRLCTEVEWEFACEGPDALPYPYGYARDGARCNHDRDELFTDRRKLIDRRVGAEALPSCTSPFGVLNMVGNVDEWTTRPENPAPRRSILRGGWWLKGRNRCRASTSSHSEIYAGPQTGFRCCMAARKTN